jgi:hypothetical protein
MTDAEIIADLRARLADRDAQITRLRRRAVAGERGRAVSIAEVLAAEMRRGRNDGR